MRLECRPILRIWIMIISSRHDDKAADHAEMLADTGEDEVGMLCPGKDRGAVLIVNSR